jgi:hypothetical protein
MVVSLCADFLQIQIDLNQGIDPSATLPDVDASG